MKGSDLKIGSIVEYLNGDKIWIKSIIRKTSNSYVWFKSMGSERIKRTTFDNYPELYRIISI